MELLASAIHWNTVINESEISNKIYYIEAVAKGPGDIHN